MEEGVVYPGEERATVEWSTERSICSIVPGTDPSCTAIFTRDCSNCNISLTLSNDVGSSQSTNTSFNCKLMDVLHQAIAFKKYFTAFPFTLREAVSPDGGPAVVVRLNPLCRSVPTTVELSFGVREENSEDKCLPLQNVTATILPGASVLLPVNVTALPLEHGQKYCFAVLDHNIESGTDRFCDTK